MSVSESRLIKEKDKFLSIDTSLPKYSYEFCRIEANTGGILVCIRNHLSNKTRNDLKIYELKSLN